MIYKDVGDMVNADIELARAIHAFRQIGNRLGEVDALIERSGVAVLNNDPQLAIRLAKRAAQVSQLMAIPSGITESMMALHAAELARENRKVTIQSFTSGLSFYIDLGKY
ncbi:hypothetical protein ACTMTI_53415 [Nonomuraea sp. H19]|uniref:hypothetical protein n=1 Tax=Nonomuraea sp. H19 TaxID=3452206 RepID=UPI003F8ACC26